MHTIQEFRAELLSLLDNDVFSTVPDEMGITREDVKAAMEEIAAKALIAQVFSPGTKPTACETLLAKIFIFAMEQKNGPL